MRRGHRALVAAATAVGMLVFAGAAFATYTPKLVVSSAGGHARIGVTVGTTDDATAKTTIYVPTGYGVATPAPGTTLGPVTATASAADLGGTVLPLTGALLAIAPTAATTAAAEACGVTPTQTWDLHLSAAGQALDIPMFVVSTVGPEAASGFVSKLVVCLSPPDKSPFGAKLLSATFTSSAIADPTSSGTFRWTSVWTPYAAGDAPNAAGTVETQSVRHLPAVLSARFTAKRVKVRGKAAKRITIRSKATAGGNTEVTSYVTTAAGKRIGGATGTFTVIGKRPVRVVVTARIDSSSVVPTGTPVSAADLFYRDLGSPGCVPTAIFQGIVCVDATAGGETLIKVYSVR